MKNELDNKLVLSVFEKIRQNGQVKDATHILGGLKAYSDFDGYTVYIEDALVQLRFGFHNQYHYEYEKEQHLEQFQKKLLAIDKDY